MSTETPTAEQPRLLPLGVKGRDDVYPSVIYPDSDGLPMAENTEQFHWIMMIKYGLDRLFDGRPDVFVAGDLLWYPVEGSPDIRLAPDALVAFGRPPGPRGSYQQWEEDDVPPQFVMEVLSPGNTRPGMEFKRLFYERFGVEEYVEYDPERGLLRAWVRSGDHLESVTEPLGWVSPRLGVRFDIAGMDLRLTYPDGQPFRSYLEVVHELSEAQRQADAQRQLAEAEGGRAERLAERLRAMGIDPDSLDEA
jgi:Uma2 family endonuclease